VVKKVFPEFFIFCKLVLVSLKQKNMELLYKELTGKIVECAVTVHKQLGPGLLESAYEECLLYELNGAGLLTKKQVPMPLIYKGKKLELGYRIDLLVDEKVIIEIKAVDALNPVHTAQVLTYLKLSGCRIGLLINFNVQFLKEGIKRIIV
jgi:GxxExxY protein